MRSPEHHTKSPKKSQYGKAHNLHNPKWPPNFNKLRISALNSSDFKIWKVVFLTQEGIWDGTTFNKTNV